MKVCSTVVGGVLSMALRSAAREIGVGGSGASTEYEAPAVVEVRGRVKPSSAPPVSDSWEGEGSWDERLEFLVDEWWKILIWVVVFLALLCLCCYFSRELLHCPDSHLVLRLSVQFILESDAFPGQIRARIRAVCLQVLLPLLGLLHGSLLGLLSLLPPRLRPPLQAGRKKRGREKELVRAAGQDEEGAVKEGFEKVGYIHN